MIRSRTRRTHNHGDPRLTFGCAACIDDMRFDQAVAAITDSDTYDLLDRVIDYSMTRAEYAEPRRVIAAARLELYRRRKARDAA